MVGAAFKLTKLQNSHQNIVHRLFKILEFDLIYFLQETENRGTRGWDFGVFKVTDFVFDVILTLILMNVELLGEGGKLNL